MSNLEHLKNRDQPGGPFDLLEKCIKDNCQILISCRNNRKILARLKAYDRHMNMVLESVREMWVEMPKGKKSQAKNKDRYVSKLFLRGDNIVLVMRNPK